MTRTAHRPDAPATDAQRAAWDAYQASLDDLAGKAYEDAEAASWDELQRALRELDDHAPDPSEPAGSHTHPNLD